MRKGKKKEEQRGRREEKENVTLKYYEILGRGVK